MSRCLPTPPHNRVGRTVWGRGVRTTGCSASCTGDEGPTAGNSWASGPVTCTQWAPCPHPSDTAIWCQRPLCELGHICVTGWGCWLSNQSLQLKILKLFI